MGNARILGSHYLSPFQTTKAMFGPTKERRQSETRRYRKAGYYSTETAKSTLPDTQETIDFLMRELDEKGIRQECLAHFFGEGHRNRRVRRPRERSANPRRKIPEDRSIRQQQSICRHRRRRERFTLPRALGEWSLAGGFIVAAPFETIVPAEFRARSPILWSTDGGSSLQPARCGFHFGVYLEYTYLFSRHLQALFFCLSLFLCLFRDKEFVKSLLLS